MNVRVKISELKEIAKDRLLGNYSVAGASFAILYLIGVLFISVFIPTIFTTLFAGKIVGAESLGSIRMGIGDYLLYYLVMGIVGALFSTLSVGTNNICLMLSREKKPALGDMFFCYKHHPDKVIIIFFVTYAVQLLLDIPVMIYNALHSSTDTPSAVTSLVMPAYELLTIIVTVVITLMLAMSYYLYLDNPELGAMDYIKKSIALMKHNKGRLFYYYLTMIGWVLLGVLSLFIGFIWISPYMGVTVANFYRDLIGEDVRSYPAGTEENTSDYEKAFGRHDID